MKKVIYILFLSLIITFKGVYADTNAEQNLQNLKLLDYSDYKNISPNNIKSLKIIRYTEAGEQETKVDDKLEINLIYNYLAKIKITDESKMSCTDNTTIYSFILNDGSKLSVEIECNWIVIKGKNYNFRFTN